MKKVISGYCRVSTDSEDQENSYENQIDEFKMEANKGDVEFFNIYADKGLTGTNANRPQFIKMLIDAGLSVEPKISIFTKKPLKNKFNYEINPNVKPKFEEIWIKHTSRFARNILSQEIIDLLIANNVHIFFYGQNLHTKDELSKGVLLQILQVLDQQDSKDKSLRISIGRETAAKKGKLISNGKLFGYDYEKGKLTINEAEAKIVKEIFTLYSQGIGIRRIINIFKEKGYKTRNNKDFGKSSISKILDNEKYAGILVTNKWDSGVVFRKHSPKHKPKNEWFIFEGNFKGKIDPIISKELFKQCQDIRNNKINTINQKGIYKGITEYAGLLVCGKCGSSYTSNVDRGRQFYNCSNKKSNGLKVCDNPNVSKKKIDEQIELFCNIFYEMIESTKQGTLDKLNLIALNLIDRLDSSNEEEINEMELKIKEQDQKYMNLIDLYSSNKIKNKDYVIQQMESIEENIKSLNDDLNNLTKSNDELLNIIEEAYRKIEELKKVKIEKNFTRDEKIEYIEKIDIWVHPDDKDNKDISFMIWNKIQYLYNDYLKSFNLNEKELNKYTSDEIEKLEEKYQNYLQGF